MKKKNAPLMEQPTLVGKTSEFTDKEKVIMAFFDRLRDSIIQQSGRTRNNGETKRGWRCRADYCRSPRIYAESITPKL